MTNILVVDDALFIRDLLKKGLRNHFPSVQIVEADNGRKAQQLLKREPADLILCDWEMPEMSGLELLIWCRTEQGLVKTPFIMVTSRGDKENVIEAIQAGVSDYIGKPFTNEQLISKVSKAFAKIGKLAEIQRAAPSPMLSTGLPNDSLAVLTAGRPTTPQPAATTTSAIPGTTSVPPPTTPTPSAPVTQAAHRPAALVTAPPKTAPPQPSAPAISNASRRGQGYLRTATGSSPCVIRALSLKEALLVIRNAAPLPQILNSAVLDLDQGEQEADVARLNGFLLSITAMEPKPDSEWLQVNFRFIDQDPQKMDYLSRLIAKGSPQKHFVPGA